MTRLVSLLKLLLFLVALSFLEADGCKPQTPDLTNECPEDSECVKPEKDQMADFACPAGYKPQAKMDRSGTNWLNVDWRYVYGDANGKLFKCAEGEWQGYIWDEPKDENKFEGRIFGTRCRRQKLRYDETDCLVHEECRKPIITYPAPSTAEINCAFPAPDDTSFKVQWMGKNGWTNIEDAKAKDRTPALLFAWVEKSAKYRCVRPKCYFPCQNQCAGMCDKSKRFSNEPINYLECVEKKAEGVSKWKYTTYNIERELSDNSICEEVLCSVASPLKSICIDGYRLCEKVKFNDDHAPVKCNGSMMYTAPNGGAPSIGTEFQCDKNTGKWWLKLMNDEYHHMQSGGNLRCIHNDCDVSKLFPNCEEGENCKKVIRDHDRFECPKSTSVWTRPNATADWEKHTGTDFLMCKRGQMLENGQEPLVAGAQLRCKSQCSWSTNYILMGVICLLAIR